MKIEPNWTISDQGPWQLIYNDEAIISLEKPTGVTSTQGYLFVGTKRECNAEIARLGLPWAVDPTTDADIVYPEPPTTPDLNPEPIPEEPIIEEPLP